MQGIAAEAVAALEGYAWPGNVRELRNLIRRAVLESTSLVLQCRDVESLLGVPATVYRAAGASSPPGTTLKEAGEAGACDAEHSLICATLQHTGGNKSQAARALHTDYKTLHLKMRQMGIQAQDFIR